MSRNQWYQYAKQEMIVDKWTEIKQEKMIETKEFGHVGYCTLERTGGSLHSTDIGGYLFHYI